MAWCIQSGQLHSEPFGRKDSTLQSHGLFALAKHLLTYLLTLGIFTTEGTKQKIIIITNGSVLFRKSALLVLEVHACNVLTCHYSPTAYMTERETDHTGSPSTLETETRMSPISAHVVMRLRATVRIGVASSLSHPAMLLICAMPTARFSG